jgi:hypothetical protein
MAALAPTDQQILARFIASAEQFQALVCDLPETALDAASAVDGWTIRQIIHHIVDDGDVWSLCIKKAIATPGVMVRFEGFPGNEPWAQALDFGQRAIDSALALIGAHRRYVAQLVEHFADRWENAVQFANPEGEIVGELTVRTMVNMLTEHLLEHIDTIAKARQV